MEDAASDAEKSRSDGELIAAAMTAATQSSNLERQQTTWKEIRTNESFVMMSATESVSHEQRETLSTETNSVSNPRTTSDVVESFTQSALVTVVPDSFVTTSDVANDTMMDYTIDDMFRDLQDSADYFNQLMEVYEYESALC